MTPWLTACPQLQLSLVSWLQDSLNTSLVSSPCPTDCIKIKLFFFSVCQLQNNGKSKLIKGCQLLKSVFSVDSVVTKPFLKSFKRSAWVFLPSAQPLLYKAFWWWNVYSDPDTQRWSSIKGLEISRYENLNRLLTSMTWHASSVTI